MKKKKGFTLAEMIAVVTIIAIIALIVTPLVINSMKESKNKLYETQLENIKSAAKAYMVDLDLDNNQDKITLTLDDLKKAGLVERDIKDPRTDELFNDCMYVEVSKNGNIYDYNIKDYTTECRNNSELQMILLGSIDEKVVQDKKYIEPGVIVKNKNGKILDVSKVTVDIVQWKQDDNGNKGVKTQTSYTKIPYNEFEKLIDSSDKYIYDINYTYSDSEGTVTRSRTITIVEQNNLECVIVPEGTINENGWITNNRRVKILSINNNEKVDYSISTNGTKNYNNQQIIDVGVDGQFCC